jgi:hypothetical protein
MGSVHPGFSNVLEAFKMPLRRVDLPCLGLLAGLAPSLSCGHRSPGSSTQPGLRFKVSDRLQAGFVVLGICQHGLTQLQRPCLSFGETQESGPTETFQSRRGLPRGVYGNIRSQAAG